MSRSKGLGGGGKRREGRREWGEAFRRVGCARKRLQALIMRGSKVRGGDSSNAGMLGVGDCGGGEKGGEVGRTVEALE